MFQSRTSRWWRFRIWKVHLELRFFQFSSSPISALQLLPDMARILSWCIITFQLWPPILKWNAPFHFCVFFPAHNIQCARRWWRPTNMLWYMHSSHTPHCDNHAWTFSHNLRQPKGPHPLHLARRLQYTFWSRQYQKHPVGTNKAFAPEHLKQKCLTPPTHRESLHPCRAPGSLEVPAVKWLWVLNYRCLTHQNVDPKGGQQSDGLQNFQTNLPTTSVCIRWRKRVFLTWALSPLRRIQILWKQLEKVLCWCAAEEHELDSLLACGNMTSSYRHREHDREELLGSEQLAHAMAKKYSGVPSS